MLTVSKVGQVRTTVAYLRLVNMQRTCLRVHHEGESQVLTHLLQEGGDNWFCVCLYGCG